MFSPLLHRVADVKCKDVQFNIHISCGTAATNSISDGKFCFRFFKSFPINVSVKEVLC